MSAITLLFVLLALTGGLVAVSYAIVLLRRGVRVVRAGEAPAWPRFHVRFYLFALLFIAFDMVVSLYYYLRVLAPAVLEPGSPTLPARPAGAMLTVALSVTAVATIAIGVGAQPLLGLTDSAHMLMP